MSLQTACITRHDGGVYADPDLLGQPLLAAIDALYGAGDMLVGVDYPVLLKALYGHGPALPRGADGVASVRLAADIQPFDPARRVLYRAVKIAAGRADYVFEPVWLPDPADPDGQGIPAMLDVDEFIADMWSKGVRCGIDVAAVRAAIASGKGDRIMVAARIDPVAGCDATIVEESGDIHRSNAPRQLPNGRIDLNSFENRFPQVQEGVRLLRKVAATRGQPGFELSGIMIPADDGKDLELASYAGPGTRVERTRDGEFIVSQQPGFLSVERATSRISVGDKIVSHDGVSVKTTGNLQLTGDYEEFGEVQEKRVIEGEGITVHGDVFGSLVSRGGAVLLHANLVGGSIANRCGDVRVEGVASSAIVQAEDGQVALERAENCIVYGTRVRIAHAVNCEVMGDDIEIEVAEGSAVAGRRVRIEVALPRKQSEMLLYVLQPEGPKVAEVIAAVTQRLAGFTELAARQQAEMDSMTSQPDLRRYLMVRARVDKNEVRLTPDQARQFASMAQAMAPALKALAEASSRLKATQVEQQAGAALLARLEEQGRAPSGAGSVAVQSVQGETQVRILGYSPTAGTPWRIPPRDLRARLRGPQAGELLFAGAEGAFEWNEEA